MLLVDHTVCQRFDNFNSKFSPFKLVQFRGIFIKVDNITNVPYFSELIKLVLIRHEISKGYNSVVEMRVSVHGINGVNGY